MLPDYFASIETSVLIDVRSEGEFLQGHIPGAINIPLLNNEERAIVGTVYKQRGNRDAVQKGFELVGGKFSDYITKAKEISVGNSISVYCWRGGMRSNIMAWLFTTAGFKVSLLKGGYKTYRTAAIQSFEEERNILILGGKTGSGKTEMLQLLKEMGEQVIDLEGIANHRGSAFGGIGQAPQPTTEQFENEIFCCLRSLDISRPIWLENESRLIGKNKIPDALYTQMRVAKVVEMLVPLEMRVNRIVKEYGQFPIELLEETTRKIERKLGNLRMNQAIGFLRNNEMKQWSLMMLEYYDDFYAYGMAQREKDSITYAEIFTEDYQQQVKTILELSSVLKFKEV